MRTGAAWAKQTQITVLGGRVWLRWEPGKILPPERTKVLEGEKGENYLSIIFYYENYQS